jgi:periplasmic protein TonB
MAASATATTLPWFPTQEDRRFRWILAQTLTITLLLGAIMPHIRIPIPEETMESEGPPRLVRLLPQPLAPPPETRKKFSGTEAEVSAPAAQQERPPSGNAAAEAGGSTQSASPADRVQALDGALSRLKMWDPSAAAAEGVGVVPQAAETGPVRNPSILTEDVTRGSGGGIPDLSPLAILGRGVSPALEGGDGVGRGTASASVRQAGRPGLSGPVRTRWEIQEILDRNKGSIYTLYNRELRVDPELHGTLLLTITIDSSGKVTHCRVIDSDLGSPTLERDLLALVRQIDFGNRPGVPVVTTRIPIEFFPR